MIYFCIIVILLLCWPLLIMPFNRFIKSKWPCKMFGWHIKPKNINITGIITEGTCPRCNKRIMKDGQGNWF